MKKITSEPIYDYYSETERILSPIKPYIGFARFAAGKTIDAVCDRNLRSISEKWILPDSPDSLSSYSAIVHSLWDEILPINQRSPTHWLDCGYTQSGKFESILCIPVRLKLPNLTAQSSAIRISGYLVAVAQQSPLPTWTEKQPISQAFCERYTEILLKGLITGWAHERGYMSKIRKALSV